MFPGTIVSKGREMMVGRIAFSSAVFSALVIAGIGASPAAAADMPLPTGSYLKSCKVLSFDSATGALSADCSGENVSIFDGRPSTPAFNVTGCKEGTIWNDNRQLYCEAASAWGNDRVIPAGSYIGTCTDRKVVGGALLVAECGMPGGKSRNASLDLRNCVWGGDISNYNGTLLCQTPPLTAAVPAQALGSLPAQPVVKPVAIEPLVKPVEIAPLAPSDPAATEDERGGDKKKKRRARGERG